MTSSNKIHDLNGHLDDLARAGRDNPFRFFCCVLGHSWDYYHLFDQAPDPENRDPGSSHWAGVCLRCGKRDLFMSTKLQGEPE